MMRRAAVGLLALACLCSAARGQGSFAQVIDEVQPKIVKIFGAGGLRGLEAYQSGFLISGQGHILTVWSYVLDSDAITVYLNDGRKFQAEVVGMDPRTEIAVLKVDAENLPALQPRRRGAARFRGPRAGLQQHVRRRLRQRAGQRAARRRSPPRPTSPPAAARSKPTIAARLMCWTR